MATTTGLKGSGEGGGRPADGFDRLTLSVANKCSICTQISEYNTATTFPPITITKSFVAFKYVLLKYLRFNQASLKAMFYPPEQTHNVASRVCHSP